MKRISLLVFSLVSISTLIGCSFLKRHPESGYSQQTYMEPDSLAEARQHMGQAFSAVERTAYEEDRLIYNLEQNLLSRDEHEHYQKYKAFLTNKEDRIAYLSLPSMQARSRWLQAKGIFNNYLTKKREIASMIGQGDLVLGMSRREVEASWGPPEFQEVSGHPSQGNERWRYNKTLQTENEYRSERRLIYFEGGVVVGWERY